MTWEELKFAVLGIPHDRLQEKAVFVTGTDEEAYEIDALQIKEGNEIEWEFLESQGIYEEEFVREKNDHPIALTP